MGFFDNIFGPKEVRNPNQQLEDGLRHLDNALGSAFSAYCTNRTRLIILSREASESYQMVKSKGHNEQTRAMEPLFREALQLIESQRKLVASMAEVSKKRRFRMQNELARSLLSIKKTEEVMRRIASANNDPSINRIQGMNDALSHHKAMEATILWPALK
jgi:hypothetical protein